MYTWTRRLLPGGTAGKSLLSLLSILVVCAVLLFVAFPWVEPVLPPAAVTVDR